MYSAHFQYAFLILACLFSTLFHAQLSEQERQCWKAYQKNPAHQCTCFIDAQKPLYASENPVQPPLVDSGFFTLSQDHVFWAYSYGLKHQKVMVESIKPGLLMLSPDIPQCSKECIHLALWSAKKKTPFVFPLVNDEHLKSYDYEKWLLGHNEKKTPLDVESDTELKQIHIFSHGEKCHSQEYGKVVFEYNTMLIQPAPYTRWLNFHFQQKRIYRLFKDSVRLITAETSEDSWNQYSGVKHYDEDYTRSDGRLPTIGIKIKSLHDIFIQTDDPESVIRHIFKQIQEGDIQPSLQSQ